ncbi:DUF2628 domain-containing protein [Terasakiella sp. SH-1]|uniref:DUF2628 domain-containing protein n=1 Tax=Terasakiella sp. SH-1 TaxID=2560057 RepID=UPI001073FF79|nr:DUF2628 domain-containing protein [Terasakiella sp. SH-1]
MKLQKTLTVITGPIMSNVLHFKNPNTGEVKVLKPGFNWLAFVSPLLLGIPLFIRRQWMFAVLALLIFPVTLIMGAMAGFKPSPAITIALLCSVGLGTAFGFLAHENYIKSLIGRGFKQVKQDQEDHSQIQQETTEKPKRRPKMVMIGGALTGVVLIAVVVFSQMNDSGSSSMKVDPSTGLIEPSQYTIDNHYLPLCQTKIANLMLNPETAEFYEAEYRYWDKPRRTSMRGDITLTAFENLPSDEQDERQKKEMERGGLVFAQNLSNLPLVNLKVRVKGHNRYGQMITSYGTCKFRERGQPTAELEE